MNRAEKAAAELARYGLALPAEGFARWAASLADAQRARTTVQTIADELTGSAQ